MNKFVSLTITPDLHKFFQNWLEKSDQIFPYLKIEDIEDLYHIAMQEFIQHHKKELKNIVPTSNNHLNSSQLIYDYLNDLTGKQIKF